MKFGITFRLFLAILLASAAAAGAMAIATRLSFQNGFVGYLNQVDAQRMDTLTANLAREYRETRNWSPLRGNYARLRALSLPEPPVQRLTLLDSERRIVAGNPDVADSTVLRPIVVDDRVVGWVGRSPARPLLSAADLSFQQEQLRAAWILAALAVVFAALLALVLSRAFLQPLKRIAAATHQLAAGSYATRVPAASRDELGKLAGDFNRLAGALERNEQLRRRFMADVSHELRTPLAVLKGELEAIEDGVRPLSREALASLNQEVAALGKLVDDLHQLSLSDVGALAYRKETFDVARVVEEAVQSFAERFRERGIVIEAEYRAAPVFADADRLKQAIRNLLENTLRYTDRGGRLRVTVRRDGDLARVDLEDSAPGVPPEALAHLFERFYRVEGSRARVNGGAGLGLAIARSIVEAHDGRIAAQASPLGGLAIAITLPASPT
jgi:two-component system, OmpR family, sensor histidine kinase BaeS